MAGKKKQKKKKTKTQKLWTFLKVQIFLILIVVAGLIYYYAGGYATKVAEMKKEAQVMVSRSSPETFQTNQTSVAYDVQGDVISVLKGEKDSYYLTSDEIPTYVKKAIVSIEDKKFYTHHGIDYKGIARAVFAMIRNGKVTQGGSTITQQLARNVFLTQEKTWERKIEELYVAVELEKKYSKDQILEFYLNNIYFGNGYYGIEAAARGYFGVGANQLSLSQVAFLCGIPNNPTTYDPLTNMDNAISRRDLILDNMLEDNMISQATYQIAKDETITLVTPEQVKYNYMETYTFYCATRALMEADGFEFQTEFDSDEQEETYQKLYDETYSTWNAALFTGGYRIYTSLDMGMQEALQYSVDHTLEDFTETGDDGAYSLQSAAVCIDNNTGMVRAIVGGRSQDLEGYTLNRAFQSYRQPGSAIKPLIVYTPILERGATADSIVDDHKFEGGPSNVNDTYLGNITLRRAVELSQNTVAWQIMDLLTPRVGLAYLQKMNFAKVSPEYDDNLAISIGGFTYGVSALEMAAGYATIENDGAYRMPTDIIKITDADGNEIWKNDAEETVIYDSIAAREMTDILETVMTEGTAWRLQLEDMPCAGKTGTTNNNKDGWFVGYTPYYTTSVWVGYDMPKSIPGLSGATYPGTIWKQFMTWAHQNLTPIQFVDVPSYIGTGQEDQSVDAIGDLDVEEIPTEQGQASADSANPQQNLQETDTDNMSEDDIIDETGNEGE